MIPDGYVVGLDRDTDSDTRKRSHLYKGDYRDPGLPMCSRGWNRKSAGYSIWRGNYGLGVCKICLRRAEKGLDGVENPYERD